MKKTYLMSYPRSGNTWLRYIVEFFAKTKSYGHTGCDVDNNISEKIKTLGNVDNNNEPFLFKRHWFEKNDNPNYNEDNLIVILRNYKECIVRHSGKKSFEDFCGIIMGNHIFGDYMFGLKVYEKWGGKKEILYYEDLIINPRAQIEKILSFFDIPIDGRLDEFMNNYELHKKESLKYYSQNIAQSATNGDSGKLKFHSNIYNEKQIKERDDFVNEKFPDLYEKYLKRYEGI